MIGEYVHSDWANFLQFSISPPKHKKVNGEKMANDALDAQSKQLTHIAKRAQSQWSKSREDIQYIENFINTFMQALRGDEVEIDGKKMPVELVNAAKTVLSSEFATELSKMDYQWGKGSGVSLTGDVAQEVKNLMGEGWNQFFFGVEGQAGMNTIAKRRHLGEKVIKTAGGKYEKVSRNYVSKKAIEARLDKLLEPFEMQLKDTANQILTSPNPHSARVKIFHLVNFWNTGLKTLGGDTDLLDLSNPKVKSFMTYLNKITDQFKGSAAADAAGKLYEGVVAMVPYLIEAMSQKNTTDMVNYLQSSISQGLKNTTITANIKSHKGIKASSVSAWATNKSFYDKVSRHKVLSNGDLVSLNYTQDKVDVSYTFNGKSYNFNAKNENMFAQGEKQNKITFLSGSNLISLVQEFDDFVNFYLNIKGLHSGVEQPNDSLLDRATIIMKLTILLKAIQGHVYGVDGNYSNGHTTNAANLIIVNNNATGQAKVYHILDILNRLNGSMDKLLADKLKTGDLDKYDDKPIEANAFIGDAEIKSMDQAKERIATYLAKLASMQLEVSITKDLIFQNKNFT